MTWKEFKSQIDEYLRVNNEADEISISRLDTIVSPSALNLGIDRFGLSVSVYSDQIGYSPESGEYWARIPR